MLVVVPLLPPVVATTTTTTRRVALCLARDSAHQVLETLRFALEATTS